MTKKIIEHKAKEFLGFVVLEKCMTVPHEGFWATPGKLRIPDEIKGIMKSFHARIRVDGKAPRGDQCRHWIKAKIYCSTLTLQFICMCGGRKVAG